MTRNQFMAVVLSLATLGAIAYFGLQIKRMLDARIAAEEIGAAVDRLLTDLVSVTAVSDWPGDGVDKAEIPDHSGFADLLRRARITRLHAAPHEQMLLKEAEAIELKYSGGSSARLVWGVDEFFVRDSTLRDYLMIQSAELRALWKAAIDTAREDQARALRPPAGRGANGG